MEDVLPPYPKPPTLFFSYWMYECCGEASALQKASGWKRSAVQPEMLMGDFWLSLHPALLCGSEWCSLRTSQPPVCGPPPEGGGHKPVSVLTLRVSFFVRPLKREMIVRVSCEKCTVFIFPCGLNTIKLVFLYLSEREEGWVCLKKQWKRRNVLA